VKTNFTILFIILFLSFSFVYAQEDITSPYEADVSTVVLLHFDNDLVNAGSAGDATAHGTTSFVTGMEGFGQAIYLNNSAINDSTATDTSYLALDHVAALDLLGDITVEGWFKYADTTAYSWSDASYLVSKTDGAGSYTYRVYSSLGSVNITGGFQGTNSTWMVSTPQVAAAFDSLASLADGWFHFTYQRDVNLKVVTMAIHDEGGSLVDFQFYRTHEGYEPVSSELPLLLGRAAPGGQNYFDGYLDEIRICNEVKYFDLPPVILYSNWQSRADWSFKLGNQDEGLSEYPVEVAIAVLGTESGVGSAEVYYRTVEDVWGDKVAMDDESWSSVSLTGGANNMFSGAIPQHDLGTVLEYYHMASSTSELETTIGAYEDSTYESFGVWQENDVVLHMSFEEEEAPFVDSSRYAHELDFKGTWVAWDDPDQVIKGDYSAYLQPGAFAWASVPSPFLSLEEYTVTIWIRPDSLKHDMRIINNTQDVDGPWWETNYSLLFRTPWNLGNDAYHDNRWPGEFPWQHGATSVTGGPALEWSHYLMNCGPESLVVQVNDADDEPLERVVYRGGDAGWEAGFIPRASKRLSRVLFTLGTPIATASAPFYEGMMDEVKVYNYQTLPGNFAKKPAASAIEDIYGDGPRVYKLSQNYPNPFNPSTTIEFTIPKSEFVSLKVYNLLGQIVTELVSKQLDVGDYTYEWSAGDMASGIYYYRLEAGDFQQVKKMVLMK
jgi:hypothetical protein